MARQSRRKHKKNLSDPYCSIPATPAPALKYSSPLRGNNFYEWVNEDWLNSVHIPKFENDFGVSEEIERCIYKKTLRILTDIKEKKVPFSNSTETEIHALSESCLHSRAQHTSTEFLILLLHKLQCIETKEDIVRSMAELSKVRFTSLLNLQISVGPSRRLTLCIDPNSPALPNSIYNHPDKMASYTALLRKLGEEFEIPTLESVVQTELYFLNALDKYWSYEKHTLKGSEFPKKYPGFPWAVWFTTQGIDRWKSMLFQYYSPKWIRFVTQSLTTLSLQQWKIYLSRCILLNCIPYCPPPYDQWDFEFFGKTLQGQTIKMPQRELLVKIVYDYFPNSFSKLYWSKEGNESVLEESKEFIEDIQTAAVHRLSQVKWMAKPTRDAAIEKVKKMKLEIGRPRAWPETNPVTLDSKCLLKNIFLLGERVHKDMLDRVGHPYRFWEEGIYRVNAFYFNENNEIIIPYGSLYPPFFTAHKTAEAMAWKFGALGSVIGHEMCHGFDEEGKNYSPSGERRRWWTPRDNKAYKKTTQGIIRLFDSAGLNGKKMLSENIADLGGVAISLEALKDYIARAKIPVADQKDLFQLFFIAYATSWRTKYRAQKLQTAKEVDHHAPAYARVNLVVSQFEEWYTAFDIEKEASLYRSEDERLRIF
jgi:putative endopeptidase